VLPHHYIQNRLQEAVRTVFTDVDPATLVVRPCADPRFGDYQNTGLMTLAKARRLNPRQVAADLVAKLEVGDCCEPVEVAGPGFLNFRLTRSAIGRSLAQAASGRHLFFEGTRCPEHVVVDFSSPNVAKPMHVGHIRSTILGDAVARLYRLIGHRVTTDNHIGDWGTQFGKLLVGWKNHLDAAGLAKDPIAEMERLYKLVNQASEADPRVLEEARTELVKLQSGDPENLRLWQEMISLSASQFQEVYSHLNIRFDHALGESFYNPRLRPVVESLRRTGLAQESEGAMVVYFPDIPELKAQPALVEKSDGGFNYTTTDLATLEFRVAEWNPDRIIYVTDGRQQLHFKQLFAIFRRWRPECQVRLEHVWFGAILGEDGRPFKTRSGETVKLTDLLDEAEERAYQVVSAKNPDVTEAERREIARVVGIGAVKYADLLPNRQTDYTFSWDKMLALNGNTAPYLLYAYTRIRSIFRKAMEQVSHPPHATVEELPLAAPQEIVLAKHLLNFGFVLELAAEEFRPNYLCNYLYELAGKFTGFYENCPVLKAEPAERAARLALCDLTGRVLKQGLEVLGLETLEKM
jgi:arginyl-tRNA synthetase